MLRELGVFSLEKRWPQVGCNSRLTVLLELLRRTQVLHSSAWQCSERLCSLQSWRLSRSNWIKTWVTRSRHTTDRASSRRLDLRSFPISVILWFWDSLQGYWKPCLLLTVPVGLIKNIAFTYCLACNFQDRKPQIFHQVAACLHLRDSLLGLDSFNPSHRPLALELTEWLTIAVMISLRVHWVWWRIHGWQITEEMLWQNPKPARPRHSMLHSRFWQFSYAFSFPLSRILVFLFSTLFHCELTAQVKRFNRSSLYWRSVSIEVDWMGRSASNIATNCVRCLSYNVRKHMDVKRKEAVATGGSQFPLFLQKSWNLSHTLLTTQSAQIRLVRSSSIWLKV